MRVIVVGAGSIGGGLGGALARAGHDVHLVARGAHLEALRAHGLRWRTPHHDEVLRLPASTLDEVVPADGDVIAVATKLQDAESVLDDVRKRWGAVPVVTWTNGILADRWAAPWASTVVATVQFVPASVPEPGTVALWGEPHPGAVHAGVVHGDREAGLELRDAMLAGLEAGGGFVTVAHDEVRPVQRTKWVRNLAGGVQALVLPQAHSGLFEAVQAEGEAVLRAAGLALATTEALLPVPMTLGTIEGHSRDGGSTWQSLTSGRPLETPWLVSPLLELAHAHGVPVPLNTWLLQSAERAMREGWREPRLTAADAPER